VTRIAVGASQQAGFAVSPDDKRIAVSIFDYSSTNGSQSPTFNGMRLYVEDVQGGGNHIEIFSSTTVAEYPIGWFKGLLVLAVSSPVCCDRTPLNPYAATSYHVVRPDTGDRIASLCDKTNGPEGPVVPAGVICRANGSAPLWLRWDGTQAPVATAATAPYPYLNALSPDGSRVAAGGNKIRILGSQTDDLISESGYVFGWIDLQHIVFSRLGADDLVIFDFQTRTSVSLPGQIAYLGTLPAAIS
jgi:hypothetical protein